MSNLLHSVQVTEHPEQHFSLVTTDIYLLAYFYWCHCAKVPPCFRVCKHSGCSLTKLTL